MSLNLIHNMGSSCSSHRSSAWTSDTLPSSFTKPTDPSLISPILSVESSVTGDVLMTLSSELKTFIYHFQNLNQEFLDGIPQSLVHHPYELVELLYLFQKLSPHDQQLLIIFEIPREIVMLLNTVIQYFQEQLDLVESQESDDQNLIKSIIFEITEIESHLWSLTEGFQNRSRQKHLSDYERIPSVLLERMLTTLRLTQKRAQLLIMPGVGPTY